MTGQKRKAPPQTRPSRVTCSRPGRSSCPLPASLMVALCRGLSSAFVARMVSASPGGCRRMKGQGAHVDTTGTQVDGSSQGSDQGQTLLPKHASELTAYDLADPIASRAVRHPLLALDACKTTATTPLALPTGTLYLSPISLSESAWGFPKKKCSTQSSP